MQSQAQEPSYRVYNMSNGLQTNTIYDVLQNCFGYLWLATEKGLIKYDGSRFVYYSNSRQLGKSLSNLVEIENGEVYCQNFSGQVFYTKGDSMYLDVNLYPSGNFNSMRRLGDYLYMTANDSLRIYSYKTGIVKKMHWTKGIYNNVFVSKGNIYLHVNDKVFQLRNNHLEFLADFQGSLLHIKSTEDGLFLYPREPKYFYKIKNGIVNKESGINEKVYINRIEEIEGKIWANTTNGIYIFNENLKQVGSVLFKDKRISQIIQDKEGSYWISTLDNGLLYIPNLNVVLFKKNMTSFTSISQYEKNRILLGTDKNEIFAFSKNAQNFELIHQGSVADEITSLFYNSFSNTIVAGSNKLASIQNGKTLFSVNYGIKDIDLIENNSYLIAHANGVDIFSIGQKVKNSNFLERIIQGAEKFALYNYNARSSGAEFSQSGNIYYSNTRGLFVVENGKTREIKWNNNSIIAASIKFFEGKLYIGGFNFCILVYDEKANVLKNLHLDGKFGTSAKKIKLLGNQLYFVNEKGVHNYNILTHMCNTWNATDGIPQGDIKDILIENDLLWIATTEGLVQFPLNIKSRNIIAPQIYLKSLFCNGKKILEVGDLDFSYLQNNILIEFAVPSFKGGELLRVYYKINETDWQEVLGNLRQISFLNLASGEYKIRIKAVNEDGIVSKNELLLHFVIHPPFYKTNWFIVCVIFGMAFIAYWVFKWRINSLKRQQQKELEKQKLAQQLDYSTLKTLRAQMNPHFIYNALNSIQSFIYSGEKEQASKYLALFSNLSRSLLDSADRTEISLFDELKLIDLYLQLECIRLPKISYEIIKEDGLEEHEIYLPAMIVQPLVENAIKHGLANKEQNGKVEIHVNKQSEYLEIKIDDNGIGRKQAELQNRNKANKPPSYASQAIESRIQILNKNRMKKISQNTIDKVDPNGNSLGTTLVLLIPINEEN